MKIVKFLRDRNLSKLKKKLCNVSPSIISSNCIGGIIYHDLGLEFKSPTINLFFFDEDFILFLENLENFLKVVPTEIKIKGYDYPIGQLKYNNFKVKLFFMHYKTFDEARKKWEMRKDKININNLFIIWEVPLKSGPSNELLNRFLNIKFKNKVLITGDGCKSCDKSIFKIKLYKNKKNKPGKILKFKLSGKRYLEQFDYVGFLNCGKVDKA